MRIILAFLLAIVLSYIATPFVIRFAKAIGAMDVPKDNRRVHKHPIPRLGGLAIYFSFIVATSLFVDLDETMLSMLLASSIIVITGVVDDRIGMGAKLKLLIQVICASIVVAGGVRIEFFANPLNPELLFDLTWLSYPVTVFWIVGITNTVNLIDGLDGLAAGISCIASITLSIICFLNGDLVSAGILLVLCGSCIGFLPYNFNPAKTFMGDTGSLFLGFVLGTMSISGMVKGAAIFAVIVPILALAIPIFDTTFAIIRRTIAGQPVMQADKGHLHHRLLARGLTQRQTVFVLYALSAFMGASSILISRANFTIAVVILALDLVVIVYGMRRLNILKKVEEKDTKHRRVE